MRSLLRSFVARFRRRVPADQRAESTRVRDELLTIIRTRLLVIPGEGPSAFQELDRIREESMPRMLEIGARRPEAVRSLLALHDFGGPPTGDLGPAGGVYELLIRMLDTLAPELLLDFILREETASPYVREMAIQRIAASRDPSRVEPLLALVESGSTVASVRAEAVKAVTAAGLEGSLAAVRQAHAAVDPSDGALRYALLRSRADHGDATAFREVVANGDRYGFALKALISRLGGVEGTLDAVFGAAPALTQGGRLASVVRDSSEAGPVRRWALEELSRSAASPAEVRAVALECLGDVEWEVSYRAAQLLRGIPESATELLRMAGDETATRERRLWAIFVLRYMGRDIGDIRDGITALRVSLHQPVPDEVRTAILGSAALESIRAGTDVRWMIEACDMGAIVAPYDDEDAFDARVRTLYEALRREGIAHEPAVDYASTINPSRYVSNYSILRGDGFALHLTLVGPFVSAAGRTSAALKPPLHRAAAEAGLLWLEPRTLDARLTGLVVHHYDQTREWTIGEYLHASCDAHY